MIKLQFSRLSTIATLFFGIVMLLSTACEKETITIQEDSSLVPAEHVKFPASPNKPERTFEFRLTTADTIQEDPSLVLAEHVKFPASPNKPEDTFEFRLAMADCIRSGRTYQVRIDAPEDYTYVWVFNDQHAGHGRLSPECLCDGSVTIYVTRSRDGLTLSRTMDLPSCPLDNE